VALFVLPPVVGLFTHRLCHELAASEARPMGGGEGHVVQRTPAGGYAEVERSASA
jgi:hypothetical protein